jgi:hypothetical protein
LGSYRSCARFGLFSQKFHRKVKQIIGHPARVGKHLPQRFHRGSQPALHGRVEIDSDK